MRKPASGEVVVSDVTTPTRSYCSSSAEAIEYARFGTQIGVGSYD